MSWIIDRLPWEYECDEDGDVLVPSDGPKHHIDWNQARSIKLGDPWMPAPPPYVPPPKTREELVQDLLDVIDQGKLLRIYEWKVKVMQAREELK